MDADRLVRAIRAALDETERLANEANVKQDDPDWSVSPVTVTGGQHFTVRSKRDMRPIARVERLDGDGGEPAGILDGRAAAEHVAHNDPAAVLRRVKADREIVDAHRPVVLNKGSGADYFVTATVCMTCGGSDAWFADGSPAPRAARHPCPTLRALARGLGINPEGTP